MSTGHLENMCKTLINSLLASKERHTLCLNISAADFAAEVFVQKELAAQGKGEVPIEKEPGPEAFRSITEALSGGEIRIVEFADLDKHPKCLDVLLDHVKNPDPGGKLVIVSRHWNSDNTDREREIRKHCLFYTQAGTAPEPKSKR